eukprot:TRINITY_DN3863_c0_g2_i1.p1 TRINITY_DN3863_c0_g2~~TRINITY_DN3863_c0_g2_i1.p1  ORF type:complete len:226 (+),score=59.55 TRINITY_DN3863_c0_g2_i1:56-733(+)
MGFFFFFKQKTAYEMLRSLVGSEMCIRDRYQRRVREGTRAGMSAASLIIPRIQAQPAHHIFMTLWTRICQSKSPALLPPDEFLQGAQQAYKHLFTQTVVAPDLGHLRDLCSLDLFEAMVREREQHSERSNGRAGAEVGELEGYIAEFTAPGEHEPEDLQQLDEWYPGLSSGVEVVTVEVTFLAEVLLRNREEEPWQQGYREDRFAFLAPFDHVDGVGQFRILTIE